MYARRIIATVAVLSLEACALSVSRRVTPEPDDRPSVVEVVNHTALGYRMSVVAYSTRRPLGIVPALETREFELPLWMVRAYDEVSLTATASDGSGDERVSLAFHVLAGRIATWTLDATRLRTVVVH